MPVVRYQIRNEYGLADPELYASADSNDPEALLEGVAMAGLVGVLRQLGDLAEFAAEIFHDLHEEVMATAARGHSLMLRVHQIEAEFPAIEKAFLSQTDHSHLAYNSGIEWHPNIQLDQNLVTRGDMPRFILNSYEECRGPPRLFMLDKFDTAGAGACLKRYSDPSFFKTDLASSVSMESVLDRAKPHKAKKKTLRYQNGEASQSISPHDANSNLQQTTSEKTSDSRAMKHIKLKMRPMHCSIASSGRSYMESILENNLPDQNALNDNLMTHTGMKTKLNGLSETSPLVHEILIDKSSYQSLVGRKKESESPENKKMMEAGLPEDVLDKSLPTDSLKEFMVDAGDKLNKRFNAEELKNAIHDFEKNGTPTDDGNMTDGSDEFYVSDDVASELDHYMDALATMESDMDTDNENKTKHELSTMESLGIDSDLSKLQQKPPIEPTDSDSNENLREKHECNTVLGKVSLGSLVDAPSWQGSQVKENENLENNSSFLSPELETVLEEQKNIDETFQDNSFHTKMESSESVMLNEDCTTETTGVPRIIPTFEEKSCSPQRGGCSPIIDISPQHEDDLFSLHDGDVLVPSHGDFGPDEHSTKDSEMTQISSELFVITEDISKNLNSDLQLAEISCDFPSEKNRLLDAIENLDNISYVHPTDSNDMGDMIAGKSLENILSSERAVIDTFVNQENVDANFLFPISEDVIGNTSAKSVPSQHVEDDTKNVPIRNASFQILADATDDTSAEYCQHSMHDLLEEEPKITLKQEFENDPAKEPVTTGYSLSPENTRDDTSADRVVVEAEYGSPSSEDFDGMYFIENAKNEQLSGGYMNAENNLDQDAILTRHLSSYSEKNVTAGTLDAPSISEWDTSYVHSGPVHSNLPIVSVVSDGSMNTSIIEKHAACDSLIGKGDKMEDTNVANHSTSTASEVISDNPLAVEGKCASNDSAADHLVYEASGTPNLETIVKSASSQNPGLLMSEKEECEVILIQEENPVIDSNDHTDIVILEQFHQIEPSNKVVVEGMCASKDSAADHLVYEASGTPNLETLVKSASSQNPGFLRSEKEEYEVILFQECDIHSEENPVIDSNNHTGILMLNQFHQFEPSNNAETSSHHSVSVGSLDRYHSATKESIPDIQQDLHETHTSVEIFADLDNLRISEINPEASGLVIHVVSAESLNPQPKDCNVTSSENHDHDLTDPLLQKSKESTLGLEGADVIISQPVAVSKQNIVHPPCPPFSDLNDLSPAGQLDEPGHKYADSRNKDDFSLSSLGCSPFSDSKSFHNETPKGDYLQIIEQSMTVLSTSQSVNGDVYAGAMYSLEHIDPSVLEIHNSGPHVGHESLIVESDRSSPKASVSSQMDANSHFPCQPNLEFFEAASICHQSEEGDACLQSHSGRSLMSVENSSGMPHSLPAETIPMNFITTHVNGGPLGFSAAVPRSPQSDFNEPPPLPPLPPLQWRLGKVSTSLNASAEAKANFLFQSNITTAQPAIHYPNLAMVNPPSGADTFSQLSFLNNPNVHERITEEKPSSKTPFDQVPTAVEDPKLQYNCYNLQDGIHHSAASSKLQSATEVGTSHQENTLREESTNHHLAFSTSAFGQKDERNLHNEVASSKEILQPINPFSETFQQFSPNFQGDTMLGPNTSNSISLDPFSLPSAVEDNKSQHGFRDLAEEQCVSVSMPHSTSQYNQQHSLFMPRVESLYDTYSVIQPTHGERSNYRRSSILNRPRDPLIEAVASHDKSTLRKVSELVPTSSKPKADERNTLLDQIRNKSFNLKPAVVIKPHVNASAANLKVAAILEKASAIRQACAGSDEDDEDNWSD